MRLERATDFFLTRAQSPRSKRKVDGQNVFLMITRRFPGEKGKIYIFFVTNLKGRIGLVLWLGPGDSRRTKYLYGPSTSAVVAVSSSCLGPHT